MPCDLGRLVSACDFDLFRGLVAALSPANFEAVDWALRGRPLADDITRVFSSDRVAWPKLQYIESLATHGGKAVVRSVLYREPALRAQLDDLDASDATAAVWIAFTDDEYFNFALSALHADRGLNKRSWAAFRAPFSKAAEFHFDEASKNKFKELVKQAIEKNRNLDAPGRMNVHHFNRVVFPEHTHSRRDQSQVTVFAEMRNVTEDVFNEEHALETRTRKKIDHISVVLDRERRELDVVTVGGKEFLHAVGHAYFQSFCSEVVSLERLIRRPTYLHKFARRLALPLDDRSRVQSAAVDEIRMTSPTGWLCTFECKSAGHLDQDVYDIAEHEFGDASPFKADGWTVLAARIRLEMVPHKPGRNPKIRTVELKPNGKTNLREHEDTDRFIADELLVGWGLIEAPRHETD